MSAVHSPWTQGGDGVLGHHPSSTGGRGSTSLVQNVTSKTKQRKVQVLNLKKKFLKKYGKVKKPALHPDFIAFREVLNSMSVYPNISHPKLSQVNDFKLNDNMLRVFECADDPKFVYVDNEDMVLEMCMDLEKQVEFALDAEMDSDLFFRECIVLLQFSTHETDYIIDPLLTFPFLKERLKPIFLNENICKVTFSDFDIKAMRRDFGIYAVGVVDVQSVRKLYFESSGQVVNNESFETLVRDLLSVQVNKDFQCFPWSLRPLPEEALQYARRDSSYLLRAWNLCKELYGVQGIDLSYSRSICLMPYKFPKVKQSLLNKEFEDIRKRSTEREKIKLGENFILFSKIGDWRVNRAKLEDTKPHEILKPDEVKMLVICKPNRPEAVKALNKQSNNWSDDKIDSLIKVILKDNSYELEEMEVEDVITDVECNPNSNFEILDVNGKPAQEMEAADCVEYYVQVCEDESPDTFLAHSKVAGEYPSWDDPVNKAQSGSDHEMSWDTVEGTIGANESVNLITKELGKVRISRLHFNRSKHQRQKQNRKKVNEDRVKLGLPKIKFKKCKGKKWQLRGQQFKEMRLSNSFKDSSPQELSFSKGGLYKG